MEIYSNDDFEVIEDFVARGAHIVPYYDGKAVPRGFSWSDGDMHLTDMADIMNRNKYRNQGMALLLNTASCVLVDIDNLLPITKFEMKALKMDVSAYKEHKKSQWKTMPASQREQMLLDEAEKAEAAVPAHAVMPSSSGKGLHFYYHARDTLNIYHGGTNIEIFGNRRLAYVTEWRKLAGFLDSPQVETSNIRKHWKPIADDLSDLKTIQASTAFKTPVTFISKGDRKRPDYLKWAQSTNYGAVSEANCCFMWFFKAFQLDDYEGVNDCALHFSGLLPASKIDRQKNGAKKFADKHPDRTTPRYDAFQTYQRVTTI